MSLLLQTPAAALSRLHRALRPGTPSPLLGATVLITGASSVNGFIGSFFEVFNLLTPRLADFMAAEMSRRIARLSGRPR